ncbi:MAG: type I restriction endonuclease subunit R [Deltaproteobacteria bacterium]|nr:type I restriction endonuclease subunit R [Deltaproteobacteria bacterium]
MYTESTVEEAALAWFQELGFDVLHGPDIDPDSAAPERASYGDVVLRGRLLDALTRCNPHIPPAALEDAARRLTLAESPSLVENNRRFHRYLTDGVPVEYPHDGRTKHDSARLFDFDTPARNDWLVVNQFTVKEGQAHRRADVVVFVNGLPLAVIELKNIASEDATIWKAFDQLQTYKAEIPSLFSFNEALVVSDGAQARIGSLTANKEWFMPWRTVEGERAAPTAIPELETLIRGVFHPARFLDYIRHFVVFEDDGGGTIVKKMGGYHQFHAVNKAVDCAVRATGAKGDRKAGVVWHTQGSGKSLSMAFFVGKIKQHPALENPTVVVLTDRNDLDGQLFSNFALAQGVLREPPVQAESRDGLRVILAGRAAGGIIFTTVQKFLTEGGATHPLLSDRANIICIADEAHRSQYDFIDGVARRLREALPNATFIGFTGTPIALTGKITTQVFGDYIDVYDIQQAVTDGATVRIFYESRLAKISLNDAIIPNLDEEVADVTEGEEVEGAEKLKSKWAQVEKLVGTAQRLDQVAQDIVTHFETRMALVEGKGMVVCMSRRICVDLYKRIVALRPAWHNEDDAKGRVKVVMTGSASDPADWQQHIRTKPRRDELGKRFRKKVGDPFKLVIVRDMWLTGFDVPSLHTMYIDKPMQGHGLMQAIARVNRVYKDKDGGLIVDYLGVAHELKRALEHYTSGDRQVTGIDVGEAAAIVQEKLEVLAQLFHGFDLSSVGNGPPAAQISLVSAGINHIAGLEKGKERFLKLVTELKQALSLIGDHPLVRGNWNLLAFYQAISAAFHKHTVTNGSSRVDRDTAMQQIISLAVVADGIVDVFAAAGLKSPDISILSDHFLNEVRGMKFRNLAVELLEKLLKDQIKVRQKKHLVQARSFSELLQNAINRYHNKSIEAAKVIEELIQLAKEMRAADRRGEDLGLTDDELAFYEALEVNDSAVKVLGDDALRLIAQELLETVRQNATIDWSMKENVRAKMRVMVRRILKKYGYPPDKAEKATQTVLEQAELMAADVLVA